MTSLTKQREMALTYYPEEWAAANKLTGKRKRTLTANLRKRAMFKAATDPIIAAGGNCGNCINRAIRPERTEPHCTEHSDFYGDQLVKDDGVCALHKFKHTTKEASEK